MSLEGKGSGDERSLVAVWVPGSHAAEGRAPAASRPLDEEFGKWQELYFTSACMAVCIHGKDTSKEENNKRHFML